jgi:hypothetical protein
MSGMFSTELTVPETVLPHTVLTVCLSSVPWLTSDWQLVRASRRYWWSQCQSRFRLPHFKWVVFACYEMPKLDLSANLICDHLCVKAELAHSHPVAGNHGHGTKGESKVIIPS